MTDVEVTEHAIRMACGSMQVRDAHPDVDRIYPLPLWIEHQIRSGGRVYRRQVIVVSDWEEVTAP